ncbi:MAG: valine--tRNA ligase [Proteobacteria bacterium]|nr:valine--tRNA ligase [Pseudomonadota bacterium]
MSELPKNYEFQAIEDKWAKEWEQNNVYRWNPAVDRKNTFIVDTPPPTVSGSLHVGHVFSYTHTDLIARYQRMLGKNIMYPMGWDDNGLPTERRVQNKFSITCNPELPYKKDWTPVTKSDSEKSEEVSRNNFIEACAVLTREDEVAFEELWKRLGLSVDWKEQYATIDNHCRKISQLSFLDLVEKGLVYNSESPTMWDITFQTALAQADLEERNMPGAYHDIRFGLEDGGEFVISTTRPELLVSCIAIVAHPDDVRYQKYFGKHAISPLFYAKVPICASEHADPEKGTGIMMVCTFGDIADVDWWKTSGLPIKQVISTNGKFKEISFATAPFNSLKPEVAAKNYSQIQGKYSNQAKKIVAQLLAEDGSAVDGQGKALIGEPKPIEHPVKFYEKGDKPLEYITTRQWFIRLLDYKKELLEQGDKINWHPSHMKLRYTHWVDGLKHDWCISRQRFFGVPFPVWYPIDEKGSINYAKPIYAKLENLPVDPFIDVPEGYKEEQRNQLNGFTGDRDVMDTWATSSLTPQIASKWLLDKDRHQKLFPMDIRPQSHEIIRTWAFYTIAKAWMHEREIPWKNVVISGWILDPDRKKMSKSKGNTVTPQHLLVQYSSDGVRYWAARARLGVDTAFDEKVFTSGKKLVTKLFNASKFVLAQVFEFQNSGGKTDLSLITEELDRSMVEQMRKVITNATNSFEKFDYAQALQEVESLFWTFCDNYVELVKSRSYDADSQGRCSAISTLEWVLGSFLRLLAPFLPYVTEEVWSWHYQQKENQPTIHRASWPKISEVSVVEKPTYENSFEVAANILSKIHFQKSQAQKSLKWPIEKLEITANKTFINALELVKVDVEKAGKVKNNAAKFVEVAVDEVAVVLEFSDTLE